MTTSIQHDKIVDNNNIDYQQLHNNKRSSQELNNIHIHIHDNSSEHITKKSRYMESSFSSQYTTKKRKLPNENENAIINKPKLYETKCHIHDSFDICSIYDCSGVSIHKYYESKKIISQLSTTSSYIN